ncbi:hypothetical protein ABC195_02970 [Microbacterium sp. 2P01SA-2]|uniref:hypothetical protein n=1 Tax=unclassified Microbacterium TaxID=2609290 RepID=UPI0039A14E17
MMTRRLAPLVLVFTAAALTAGCAPAAEGTSAGTDGSTPAANAPSAASEDGGTRAFASPDCAAVEAVVAPYIDGLVAREDNGSDEYGTLCGWEAPEGTIDLDDIRSVEVSISPDPAPPLSAADLETVGFTPIPDAAVEAAGGIAYTSGLTVPVAAVIVTTVTLPDVEVIVTGGQWADQPALDGPAAVDVAARLLGLR